MPDYIRLNQSWGLMQTARSNTAIVGARIDLRVWGWRPFYDQHANFRRDFDRHQQPAAISRHWMQLSWTLTVQPTSPLSKRHHMFGVVIVPGGGDATVELYETTPSPPFASLLQTKDVTRLYKTHNPPAVTIFAANVVY